MDCLAPELFLNSCFLDTVTLLRTAVQTANNGVHKLLSSHWRGPHLLNIVVLAVADGLFGVVVVVEMLLYVHRNRRLFRDGSPGRPPRLSHSS